MKYICKTSTTTQQANNNLFMKYTPIQTTIDTRKLRYPQQLVVQAVHAKHCRVAYIVPTIQ